MPTPHPTDHVHIETPSLQSFEAVVDALLRHRIQQNLPQFFSYNSDDDDSDDDDYYDDEEEDGDIEDEEDEDESRDGRSQSRSEPDFHNVFAGELARLFLQYILQPLGQDVPRPAHNRNHLPVFPYKKPSSDRPLPEEDGLAPRCTICLMDYEEGEELKALPCLHKYHVACIDHWLASNNLCPVCKHEVDKVDLILPDENASNPPLIDLVNSSSEGDSNE